MRDGEIRIGGTALDSPSAREIARQGKRLRGPERIETGWWDGREVRRDYFQTRAEDGAKLWVYRERRAPQHWYVHGLFG